MPYGRECQAVIDSWRAARRGSDDIFLEPTQDAVLRLLAAAADHRGIGVELLKGTAMIFDARLDGHERTTFLAPAEPDAPRQALRQTVTLATALALSGAALNLSAVANENSAAVFFLPLAPIRNTAHANASISRASNATKPKSVKRPIASNTPRR